MFAKFYRTFHTTQNYPPHFEEVGNRILNIKFSLSLSLFGPIAIMVHGQVNLEKCGVN